MDCLYFVLLAGLAPGFGYCSPGSGDRSPDGRFDPDSRVIAPAGVIMTSGDFQLQAETVFYNQETEIITAEQGVRLQTAAGNWEGKVSSILSIRRRDADCLPRCGWLVFYTGQTGELRGEEILVQGGSFTRCELTSPCVRLKRAGPVG